jgi:hypothetical protein
MANHRFSASRFGTYLGCKTKYKHVYQSELVVVGREAEVALKGTSFHLIAEKMEIGWTLDQLYDYAKEILGQQTFDQEKYPVIKSIPRFYRWWQEYVEPAVADGFKLYKENWENSSLNGKALCGAIDVLLINDKTKEVKIFDYKTAASAKLDGYEGQLLLYAYMISKRLKIAEADIPSKIKLYLFFPLAGIKTEDPDDADKVEKNMLKNVKQLIYTAKDVSEKIAQFAAIIDEDEKTDWDALDLKQNATMNFTCGFCQFCGHPRYCPLSYESGLRFPRKALVMPKDEYKKYLETHENP